jgi:predicted anti-sigma-YlaC factor YlaD
MNLLSRDLTCQQAVELVTNYLEGALPRRQRRRFEEHLRSCANCSTYLEQIRTTIRLTGRLEADQLEPETREGIIDLYRRYRS